MNLELTYEEEQHILGRRIGLSIGDFVELSSSWGSDKYSQPKYGKKLQVHHFTLVGDSIWVSVTYPESSHTMPIYEHWKKFKEKKGRHRYAV